jgi:hypothetical protein
MALLMMSEFSESNPRIVSVVIVFAPDKDKKSSYKMFGMIETFDEEGHMTGRQSMFQPQTIDMITMNQILNEMTAGHYGNLIKRIAGKVLV